MDRNEQVARKLGLRECSGHYPTDTEVEVYYCWIIPGGKSHSFEFQPTDYVGDIKAAMTLVPKIGQLVTMQYEAGGCPTLTTIHGR